MNIAHRALALAVSLALAVGLAGCRADHDADHHDHDHAGHVDPDHWPRDFPSAVALLLAGHAACWEAQAASRGEQLDRLLHIQRDLAKWLPEVAADSDMPEEPWNRVDAVAERLLKIYESAIGELDSGRPTGDDQLTRAKPLLTELKRLDEQADPSWFRMRSGGLSKVEEISLNRGGGGD